MPYRKEEFADEEIYHVVIRSIDDNLLFKDIDDYYRGIFSIYEFNDTKPAVIRERRQARLRIKEILKQAPKNNILVNDPRDKLVEILSFSFMPNHIHLLLRQIKNNGITRFMRKLGAGYGGYFNRKYGRKGHVLQNRFNAVHIKTDNQLRTVLIYIHTNSISLIEPEWKMGKTKNLKNTTEFLNNYKWSSHRDYLDINNFPSVTEREFLLEIMGGVEDYQNAIKDWIKHKKEIKGFNNLAIE
ncbi:MAG: transposase [bacterium]|nr:transposase [bacterium]